MLELEEAINQANITELTNTLIATRTTSEAVAASCSGSSSISHINAEHAVIASSYGNRKG